MRRSFFIMVPFVAGAGGALLPGQPIRARAKRNALAIAAKAARLYAGAAVIEQPADDFAEPRLVDTAGRVPATIAALAA